MSTFFFGFSQGLYGRLDKDYVFQTTVTNVEPTAKQSRVLNPYVCRYHITQNTIGCILPHPLFLAGPLVPPYGHRPRTSALTRLPRLLRFRVD